MPGDWYCTYHGVDHKHEQILELGEAAQRAGLTVESLEGALYQHVTGARVGKDLEGNWQPLPLGKYLVVWVGAG